MAKKNFTPLNPCPKCGSDPYVERTQGVFGLVCRTRWFREKVKCKKKKCGHSVEGTAPGRGFAKWNKQKPKFHCTAEKLSASNIAEVVS